MPAVQTKVSQWVANYLSNELNARVSIQGVDIDLLKTVVLEGLYIEDLHKDTLLFAGKLKVDISLINLENNKFTFDRISLEDANFYLKKYPSEERSNLHFILDYFSSDKKKENTTRKAIEIRLKYIGLKNIAFKFINYNKEWREGPFVDFNNIEVRNVNVEIRNFSYQQNEMNADIANINLIEKSGLNIEKLQTKFKFSTKEIELDNLYLQTPNSVIKNYYAMHYDSIADMSDYINKVRMSGVFADAVISSKDICYFAPALSGYTQHLIVNGNVNGTISHLYSKHLVILTANQTLVEGKFDVNGLPDINKTIFDLQFQKVQSNKDDIESILSNIGLKHINPLPVVFDRLGDVSFHGNFKGSLSDFETNGRFDSESGSLIADLSMLLEKGKVPQYRGTVETIDLDLGILAQSNVVGKASMVAMIDGQGFSMDQLNTRLVSNIERMEFKGYEYKNVVANGTVKQRFFEGNVSIDEPNIVLDFDGSIDFSDQKNPVFNFFAQLENVNLKRLNLLKDSILLSSTMDVNFVGTNIDDIIGSLRINNTEITTAKKHYLIKSIGLNSEFDGSGKTLKLTSDIADANVSGDYKLSTIVSSFKAIFKQYAPGYDWGKINKPHNQDFRFALHIKDADPITELFVPDLKFAENANFYGVFNYAQNRIRFSGGIDYVKYKNFTFDDLIIDAENDDRAIGVNIASHEAFINDSININNIAVSSEIVNDSLRFNIKLSEKTDVNQLDLNGLISFRNDSSKLQILPSELLVDSRPWEIKNAFNIVFSSDKKIHIHNFSLSSEEQSLSVDGVISDNPEDQVSVKIQNLGLLSFNQLLKKYGIHLEGKLNAEASIVSIKKDMRISSNIFAKGLIYNSDTIGNLAFTSTWDRVSNEISLSGNITNQALKTVDLYGSIYTQSKTDNFDLYAILNETDLAIIEPFVKNFVSGIDGKATANLRVKGSFNAPEITGKALLKDVVLTVNYLKATMTINDEVEFQKDKILIEDMQVRDKEGNPASINGVIKHQNLKNFSLDVNMQAKNFLCLNTTAKDNELYYGTAYASGSFSFKGPLNAIKIDITAKTEKGTKFFIPISDENSAKQQNYIRFIQKDSTLNNEKYTVNLSGIAMNMNLEVNELAEVQLILDPATGEVIKGTGNANLRLGINTLGNFEMFGVYEVEQGNYNFTLQNIITRNFSVAKGGTIRWNGDPIQAKIDLTAIYETRPAILPLLLSANPADSTSVSSGQRVLSQCMLYMKNDLMSPDISFGLRFPEDEDIASKVGGYLANTDNLNSQVASILVFGRFNNTSGSNNLAFSSGILEAQLANLVSTKNFDLNLANGVGGSLRLLNDRVTIDGTFNTNDNSNDPNQQDAQANAITGDVSVEYKISEDGRFRARGFRRTDNNNDLLKRGNSQVESGAGVFYRIDYDSFGEFFRKVFRREEEK